MITETRPLSRILPPVRRVAQLVGCITAVPVQIALDLMVEATITILGKALTVGQIQAQVHIITAYQQASSQRSLSYVCFSCCSCCFFAVVAARSLKGSPVARNGSVHRRPQRLLSMGQLVLAAQDTSGTIQRRSAAVRVASGQHSNMILSEYQHRLQYRCLRTGLCIRLHK